jgi:hypothetical protein
MCKQAFADHLTQQLMFKQPAKYMELIVTSFVCHRVPHLSYITMTLKKVLLNEKITLATDNQNTFQYILFL